VHQPITNYLLTNYLIKRNI